MAERKVRVRVNEGHAINMGDEHKPDMKEAGQVFECPKANAEALAEAGCVVILNNKEENEDGK